MLKKIWDYKKIRFLCVGSFNSLLDLSILNVLVFGFHFPVWLGNALSVSVSISVSYLLNHFIVFRRKHDPNYRQFIVFFLITGIGIIAIQTTVIYLLTTPYNHLLLNHVNSISKNLDKKLSLNMAKITAILVGMTWNYILYSKIVFKKNEIAQEQIT
jgi:putative flippase GtrA